MAFAAILMGGAAPSAAASYSLAFTGAVTAIPGPPGGLFGTLGLVAGDFVSGTVTINSFNADIYSSGPVSTVFSQPSVAYSFHLEHPGAIDMTISDTGPGDIVTAGTPSTKSGMQFQLFGAKSYFELTFQTDVTGGPLTTLAALPSTATELIALFGGTTPQARGMYTLDGFGTVMFDIAFSATAVTPIPAALPLFLSALGGLGLLARRRRVREKTA
ncbi:hypothetical protein [Dongia sedimenti]|uniref:Secreted protein n=1 Tax=Dongia sedimenti TaxID=3064282 RepID=A0ABU0YK12_9PROT|nr:hypothetical protein [Rhodospirillaceae bacterium R-7]